MKTSIFIRQLFLSFLFTISLTLLYSCNDDDSSNDEIVIDPDLVDPEPMLDIEEFRAGITAVSDDTNIGNVSDITVAFSGGAASSDISEYRVFYVLSTNQESVTEESAKFLADNQQTVIPNNATTFEFSFQEDQLDFEGAAIIENEEYVVFVLSVGIFNEEDVFALSAASSTFQLVNNIEATTLISDFPANDGLFVTADGTIFASDFGDFDSNAGIGLGTKVYEISPEGSIAEKVSGYVAPMGGVEDSKGNFYFTHENGDPGNSGKVIKIAPDGTATVVGEIDGWPSGLTIDENDNIYAANFALPTVHKVTPDGTISLFATDPKLAGCVGIDIDSAGNIVTANFFNGNILSIDAAGNTTLFTTIPDVAAGFGIGYMTIFEDNIYATGIGTHVIYRVTTDGTSEIFAGNGTDASVDGELLDASFSQPNGIAVDEMRRILYITQYRVPGLRTIKL